MKRQFMVFLLALAFAILCASPRSASTQTARRPNIIFIMADDLGYGNLGVYGQKLVKTPNIDRLAAEGIRFTQYYAGSTVCAPSRSVLMTGLHTGHTYIRGNSKDNFRPEDLTVAEVLKRAGYRTGLIGKWGLGHEGSTGVPTRQVSIIFTATSIRRTRTTTIRPFSFATKSAFDCVTWCRMKARSGREWRARRSTIAMT
jgi:arylsulfatase A-like enzyme